MKHSCRIIWMLLLVCGSCVNYTPKPIGYLRIDPKPVQYRILPVQTLPYSFRVPDRVTLELPPEEQHEGWLNLFYPDYNARIYCSYIRINPRLLEEVIRESEELVQRNSVHVTRINRHSYENPEQDVYATLFLLEGETASPVQFMLTDSSSHFFRGALFYNVSSNADSLAPVTQLIQQDVMKLIETFNWRK